MKYWKYDPQSDSNFDPRFRKATAMMKVLAAGMESVFSVENTVLLDRTQTEVFLGSHHGEIESTFNYLKGLSQSKVGRPFLFQNSLHHSTTGFVSQHFELLGPTYSICVIEKPQIEIMVAALMQALKNRKPVLMIHTESFPQELAKISTYKVEAECEFFYIDSETVDSIEFIRSENPLGLEVQGFIELFEALKRGDDFCLPLSHVKANFKVKKKNVSD